MRRLVLVLFIIVLAAGGTAAWISSGMEDRPAPLFESREAFYASRIRNYANSLDSVKRETLLYRLAIAEGKQGGKVVEALHEEIFRWK